MSRKHKPTWRAGVFVAVIMMAALFLLMLAGCASSAGTRASNDGASRSLLTDGTEAERQRRALAASVQHVLADGVANGAYPGAYAMVGTSRDVLVSAGVGQLGGSSVDVPTDSTVWDLASLTKVVATTSAVLTLVADGLIALDEPAARYLPRWTADGANSVTIRHLLTHSSGLPAWRPLYKEAWSAEEALAQVYATGPDTTPGAAYVYSDLGFILLGEVVREVSGMPLDSYTLSRVFLPLGMRETRFHPPATWRSRTAPTERDPWRQRALRGEVHDENAFQLGEVAGHAGLFATARDLARFAQTLLAASNGDGSPVFPRAILSEFTTRQSSGGAHRALGWETPTGANSGGRQLSTRAFGHTGFTGTSVWVDPAQDLFVVLLTNRVHPTRERRGIAAVRPALVDTVAVTLARRAALR